MNEGHRPLPDEDQGRLALETLERLAPADPAFRARLRQAFATGELETRPVTGLESPPAREEARPIVTAPRPSWWRPPVIQWAAPVLAMAALALGLVLADRGPAWEVMEATGSGIAIVGERPIPMNHVEDLRRWIRPGVRVRVPEGATLQLVSRGQLGLHLEPGADVTVPGVPGRWFARTLEGGIASGVVRITSLPDFRGARLIVMTPEARVEVTGTTLAVIREPQGTCVCVLEGTVQVSPRDGAPTPVPRGERRFIFNDGRPPESAEMRGSEVDPLGEFHEKCVAMPRR